MRNRSRGNGVWSGSMLREQKKFWLTQGLAAGTALLTFGVAGRAMAADLGSGYLHSGRQFALGPLVDMGVSDQGCTGVFGLALDFDAVLFEAQSPCEGFQAFDLAFLAIVALIVISTIRFRHATARRRLELARRMVEKGLEPPPELLGARRANDLRRGLVLVCTGVGLVLASMFGNGDLSTAGLIPGFIGVGYLISHRFAVRDGGPQ